jgi:hypothetical protein
MSAFAGVRKPQWLSGRITLGFLCLLILAGAGLLYYHYLAFPNPWKPVTNPHDPECKTGCVEFKQVRIPHGPRVKVYARPGTDDETAQWGDCLRSITSCVDSKGTGSLRQCVADSNCPLPCKSEFMAKAAAARDAESLFEILDKTFVQPGAFCLPRNVRSR